MITGDLEWPIIPVTVQTEYVLSNLRGLTPLTNWGLIINMLSALMLVFVTEELAIANASLGMREKVANAQRALICALVTINAHIFRICHFKQLLLIIRLLPMALWEGRAIF